MGSENFPFFLRTAWCCFWLSVALLFAIALVGCAGGARQTGIDVAQDAGLGVVRNLSLADYAALRRTCQAAGPALAAATSPSAPQSVKDISVYGKAFCDQVVTETLGNRADQSSLGWLTDVLAGVKIAAQIAGFVLPLL